MDPKIVESLVTMMNAMAVNLDCQTALMRRSSTLIDQQIEANRAVLPILEKMGDVFEKAEPLIDTAVNIALAQAEKMVEEES